MRHLRISQYFESDAERHLNTLYQNYFLQMAVALHRPGELC
jgi:hypothetical protein